MIPEMQQIDNKVLHKENYYEWAVWSLEELKGLKITQILVKVGICQSSNEAKQKIKEGAIREGCSIWLTPWENCKKITKDRLVEEWDLFRKGRKAIIIYGCL